MPVTTTPRQQVHEFVRLRLGDQMIDVELDPDHYDSALDFALLTYRQRAANSVEEAFAFLELQEDQTEYIVPEGTISIKSIYRRGVGTATLGTTFFDPFQAAYVNTYLINTGRIGGLLTYELFAGYQEQAFRMFGGHVTFSYNPVTRTLLIPRKVLAKETVMLHVFKYKSEEELINNLYSGPWVRSFSLAQAKMMLGQAREKFASIAGPQGGTQLNGTALKSEATAEMTQLIDELKTYIDGSFPPFFVIG